MNAKLEKTCLTSAADGGGRNTGAGNTSGDLGVSGGTGGDIGVSGGTGGDLGGSNNSSGDLGGSGEDLGVSGGDFVEERSQRAVEYFMKGYGCGQSVAAAFADLYGLSEEQALGVGAGFGGGIGKMRMICGAVSGMVILAGLEKGNVSPGDVAAKGDCYKLVQDLVEAFRQENGSIICAELLGLKGPVAKGDFMPSERNAEYYKVRPCSAKVESAARIFARYLEGRTDKTIPF